jgi:hypothetical protein
LAYELQYDKLSPKKEKDRQIKDMRQAKQILEKEHPGIKVILVYGHLADRKKRSFVFSQIF